MSEDAAQPTTFETVLDVFHRVAHRYLLFFASQPASEGPRPSALCTNMTCLVVSGAG